MATIVLMAATGVVAPPGVAAVEGRTPIWTAALANDPASWLFPGALVVSERGDRLFALLHAQDWSTGRDAYRVVALGADTGRRLWRWNTATREDATALAIGPRGGQVYVASQLRSHRSRLTALSASTGKVLWRVSRDGRGWWYIAVSPDGHTIYVSGIRPRTEVHRQVRTVLAAYAAGTGALRWSVPLGDSVFGSSPGPVATTRDGSVVVAAVGLSERSSQPCPDAAATAVSAATGRPRWTTRLGRMSGCGDMDQIDVSNGIVLASWDRWGARKGPEQNVNGLRLADGSTLWHRSFDGLGQTSAISAGRLAVSIERYDSERGRLIVLEAATGSTLWSKPETSGAPVFSPNGRRLYLAGATRHGDDAAIVRARFASSGALRWSTVPYRGPLQADSDYVPGSTWESVTLGPRENRIFVAGVNWFGSPLGEAVRTIAIFGAYRA